MMYGTPKPKKKAKVPAKKKPTVKSKPKSKEY